MDNQALPGAAGSGDHRVFSNFFSDHNIIQNVAIVQPKNLLISALRDIFRSDSIFTYRDDQYGYPLTPDLTGIDIDSELTTKILISDVYRYEVKFFPAIVIKANGGTYKPLSFNQNMTLKHREDIIENSYGSMSKIKTPTHRIYAGMWDLSFDVSIYSESHSELEELTEIASMALQYSLWQDLRANGLFIKSLSIGGENAEPYANDFVYSQNITLSTFSEWRVEIPLDSIIEKLVFYFDSTRHPIPGQKTQADVAALNYSDILEKTQIG
mgnify:CR=1 FL=1|tara:strand:+ start:1369 stop:2175 length:807 start_codon:yes stop_codon:yes gene_type:complete